ncbi:GAF and ANTAR domain-containing protein [Modestobacter italicus]|uniref:GAF and ANTAR domain-containing protein n=1 Tax=Modestobacter italicus (strain DSM 44449 / CECT 9708 / BC 501) TaxID=2732864 RepID=UPI001C97AAF8|nr:GAF and ANTAR domain-containing protein [Modestobacter italicus]
MTARELLIADTFVELAGTLVDDFDLIDFLHALVERTVALVDADAGGIMLADQRGGLEVMAASTHDTRLVELFELQHDEGPCLDAFRTGEQVTKVDEAAMRGAWPTFTARLSEAGFASAQAIPLRLQTQVIGALNVFRVAPGALSAADMKLARALADVATVAIVQQRVLDAREQLAEQLQEALTSRIRVEQAKGILAERSGVGVDAAFTLMRTHARRSGLPLRQVVDAVISGAVLNL